MGDPLSVMSGVAGLISLADTIVTKGLHYIDAYKNGPEEIGKLIYEVNYLYGTLNSLHLVFSRFDRDDLQFAKTNCAQITGCYQLLTQLEKALVSLDSTRRGNTRFEKYAKKLQWPFKKSQTEEMMRRVQEYKATFTLALSSKELPTLMKVLDVNDNILEELRELKDEQRRIQQNKLHVQLDKKRKAVYDWYSAVDSHTFHKAALNLHQSGTGQWFLQDATFIEWVTKENAFLWVHGIPGSGKTILTALAIEEMKSSKLPGMGLAYFYCDYKVPQSQDLANILGSLVRQLAVQSSVAFDRITELYDEFHDYSTSSTSLPELESLLTHICNDFDSVTIILDGIDECDRFPAREKLLDVLERMIESKIAKLLVSSRDEIDISHRFATHENCPIRALPRDIEIYVHAEITLRTRSGRLKIRSQDVKDFMIKKLVDGAKGMFQWVKCQLDNVAACPTDRAKRKALCELPPTLDGTYERILERLGILSAETQMMVKKALQYLVVAARPLTLEEIVDAVSVVEASDFLDKEGMILDEDLLAWCGSLVRINSETEALELSHSSVQEFLMSERILRGPAKFFSILDRESHVALAQTCITYLSYNDFENEEAGVGTQLATGESLDYSFYQYATNFWHFHACGNDDNEELFRLLRSFFGPSKAPQFWTSHCLYEETQTLRDFVHTDEQHIPDRLRLACICNLRRIVEALLDDGFDINLRRMKERVIETPMENAVISLVPEMVDLLLERGAKVAVRSSVEDVNLAALAFLGFTTTYRARNKTYATIDNLKKTLEKLLERGVDVDDLDIHIAYTPYEMALSLGDQEVLELIHRYRNRGTQSLELLQQGAQLKNKNIMSSFKNSKATHLLTFGDDCEGCSEDHSDDDVNLHPVDNISRAGRIEIRNVCTDVLGHGSIDQLGVVKDQSTLRLKLAVIMGSQNLILSNFKRGANLASHDSDGNTALHHAILYSHTDIIKLLLDLGAPLEAEDSEGMTPLHILAFRPWGNLGDVEVLIDKGVNLEAITTKGNTPLMLCAMNGNINCAKILLKRGANIFATDPQGRNALHIASYCGHHELASFLLYSGADVSTEDLKGRTALCRAAKSDNESTIELLVGMGSVINHKTKKGMEPLHIATRSLSLAATKVLLEAGADIASLATDENNPTCLHSPLFRISTNTIEMALTGSMIRVEMVQYLCSHINDSNAKILETRDGSGMTALIRAAYVCGKRVGWSNSFSYDELLLKTLLNSGAQIDAVDECSLSALHHLVLQEFEPGIALLVNRGANVNLRNWDGQTALHAACGQGLFNIAKLLLSNGGDKTMLDNAGRTPISLALAKQPIMQSEFAALFFPDGIPSFVDLEGRDPLCDAIVYGRMEAVEFFLDKNVDINSVDKSSGNTPLLLAGSLKQSKIVELLIARGAQVTVANNAGIDMIHHAVFDKDPYQRMLRLLMKQPGINFKRIKEDKTAVHEAALRGNAVFIKVLFENQAELESLVHSRTWDGKTPLHLAASGNHLEVCKILVEYKADIQAIDANGVTPLHSVVTSSGADEFDTTVLDFLILNGAKVDAEDQFGCTPLYYAVSYCSLSAVKAFIQAGANVAHEGKGFKSALFRCVRPNFVFLREKLCQTLLDNGARVDAEMEYEGTPLHCSCEYGYEEVTRIFLNHAKTTLGFGQLTKWLNFWSPRFGTPLYAAVRGGNLTNVALLIEAGSRLDDKGGYYGTPLHYACAWGLYDIVCYLLEQGANPSAIEKSGKKHRTPKDLAIERNFPQVASLVQRYEAPWREKRSGLIRVIPRSISMPVHRQFLDLLDIGSRVDGPSFTDHMVFTILDNHPGLAKLKLASIAYQRPLHTISVQGFKLRKKTHPVSKKRAPLLIGNRGTEIEEIEAEAEEEGEAEARRTNRPLAWKKSEVDDTLNDCTALIRHTASFYSRPPLVV